MSLANDTEQAPTEAEMVLILEIAWSEKGNWYTRLLSSIMWVSVVLRALCNSILFVSLARLEALRQHREYVLMMYVTFFDLIDTFKHFCITSFDYGVQTRIMCLLTFRNLWLILGNQSAVGMLVAVSIDRLLSTLFPFWYWKQQSLLSHRLAAVVFGWTFIFGCYLVLPVLRNPEPLIPFCNTILTFGDTFKIERFIRTALLWLSVAIYVVVWFVFKYQGKLRLLRVAEAGNNQEIDAAFRRFNKRQRAATVTLGLSATITLLLHILPLSGWAYVCKAFPPPRHYAWRALAVPVHVSSMANLILFGRRHDDVKKALIALFTCKKMPSNHRDWHITMTTML